MNRLTNSNLAVPDIGDADAIAQRLAGVRRRVADAARHSGRGADDVTIVAIGKTWGSERIEAAARAGQRHFGESRAQELRDKRDSLAKADGRDDLTWHFVGRLQTNKVKYVVGACDLVHSLDRWDLAESLAARAELAGVTQDVLVQVHADDDPAKAGLDPSELPAFLHRLETLATLRCTGLMTMPAMAGDPARAYGRLRGLRDDLRADHPGLAHLSMGMSGDYETAVREGATMVRPGEAVFGPRRGR